MKLFINFSLQKKITFFLLLSPLFLTDCSSFKNSSKELFHRTNVTTYVHCKLNKKQNLLYTELHLLKNESNHVFVEWYISEKLIKKDTLLYTGATTISGVLEVPMPFNYSDDWRQLKFFTQYQQIDYPWALVQEIPDFYLAESTHYSTPITYGIVNHSYYCSNASLDSLILIKKNDTYYPALPPMQTIEPELKKHSLSESSVKIANNEIIFSTIGSYQLINPQDSSQSFFVSIQKEDFPSYTEIEDLAPPLCYITTFEEFQLLTTSDNPKKAMDKFWLTIVEGDEQAAIDIIKLFYQRIETSNQLFTSYKPGWMTDKGMLYLIFGPPNKQYFSGDVEFWIYLPSDMTMNQTLSFTFVKSIGPYGFIEQTLLRKADYKDDYYRAVETWRFPDSFYKKNGY